MAVPEEQRKKFEAKTMQLKNHMQEEEMAGGEVGRLTVTSQIVYDEEGEESVGMNYGADTLTETAEEPIMRRKFIATTEWKEVDAKSLSNPGFIYIFNRIKVGTMPTKEDIRENSHRYIHVGIGEKKTHLIIPAGFGQAFLVPENTPVYLMSNHNSIAVRLAVFPR